MLAQVISVLCCIFMEVRDLSTNHHNLLNFQPVFHRFLANAGCVYIILDVWLNWNVSFDTSFVD